MQEMEFQESLPRCTQGRESSLGDGFLRLRVDGKGRGSSVPSCAKFHGAFQPFGKGTLIPTFLDKGTDKRKNEED